MLTIFDLQRFALHDGPGIRTTVFLKGCPLDCLWCHNPESKKKTAQLGFLEKNCTGCGRCRAVCPQMVHEIWQDGQKNCHKVVMERCIRCGKCVTACPNHALKMYGREVSAEEIMEIVRKDKDFYQRSGGGFTISGGEPMVQFENLLDLVKKQKKKRYMSVWIPVVMRTRKSTRRLHRMWIHSYTIIKSQEKKNIRNIRE